METISGRLDYDTDTATWSQTFNVPLALENLTRSSSRLRHELHSRA